MTDPVKQMLSTAMTPDRQTVTIDRSGSRAVAEAIAGLREAVTGMDDVTLDVDVSELGSRLRLRAYKLRPSKPA